MSDFNIRDVSWLSFNDRVLQEAENKNAKLLDRLRFLGIYSNNYDEFYRVRVATIKRMLELDNPESYKLDASPTDTLNQIQKIASAQRIKFDLIFREILGAMKLKGIEMLKETELNPEQQKFVVDYFNTTVRTTIVPIMLESIPHMPNLNDDSIYLSCVLNSSDNPFMQRYALIQIPTDRLPRFVILPSEKPQRRLILLEDIIRYCLPNLFQHFGFDTFSSYVIKLTKDAEIDLSEEMHEDYPKALRKAIEGRRQGKAVRFIYDSQIDPGLLHYLTERLNIDDADDVIAGGRIHNFKDFMNFPSKVFRKSKERLIKPFIHPKLKQPKRIMQMLDREDIMLHFPYHSFDSIIDILREAAIDPQVETIKLTAYRLAKNSKVVHALISAAQNGKDVTVVIELKARFDEKNNLDWKIKLEESGVKVLLGVRKMKVHSKLCLITKVNEGKKVRYGFVSTGNFNENTADLYADHCLLTSDTRIMDDLERIFVFLEDTDKKNFDHTEDIITSPDQTRHFFLEKMDEYLQKHSEESPSKIFIKLNSLVDKPLINRIYDLHRAGVDLFLNIRSICCAKTQHVEGFTHPIKATSIVDNLLEHARVFIFQNGEDCEIYMGSSDWMIRNLDHRIEATCQIYDPALKQEMLDIYKLQMADTVKARILDDDQQNKFVPSKKKNALRSQVEIYNYLRAKKNNP